MTTTPTSQLANSYGPLTRTQGDLLCQLVHSLRRDWDIPGVAAAVREAARTRPGVVVAAAMLATAGNPAARTPAAVLGAGPQWDPARQALTPDPPHPRCEPHGSTWPCRECGDTTPGVPCPDDVRTLLAGITSHGRTQHSAYPIPGRYSPNTPSRAHRSHRDARTPPSGHSGTPAP